MSKEFVHLHVHTEYSLLDGASRIDALINKAKELNMSSIAITDHGSMFGVIDMYKKCKKAGIKPIIGCEVYVAPRSRFDKEGKVDTEPNHLILLAKNEEGYKNLIKLVSIAYTEGFYYKPRIDNEILRKYSSDLVCLTACLAGAIPRYILDNNYEKAKELAIEYNEVFGKDNFYLEMQDNKMSEQKLVNQKLVQLSKETGIPLVVTNDVHYVNREDSEFHDVLLCVQTSKKVTDTDRMKMPNNEFYFKSADEMEDEFVNFPEAMENTNKIASMCNVDFEFSNTILPEFKTPNGEDNYEYFKKMCYDNIPLKYGIKIDEEVIERLEYELSVISKMGFIDYFLIVADFIDYAKKNDIAVGPGRGSGAGSIAAYLSGITDIDPLRFNLIFERFLNPDRISMPDFDIDFCYTRRPEVIDYVARRYGADHVAQIITFGTMASRLAVRDIGRALDIPYAKMDMIAKMIPMGISINDAVKTNSEIKEIYEEDDEIKKVIDMAMKAEGMPRHASTHAAGVVITKDPVDTYVPLYRNGNNISTQFPMTTLEEIGLLKMDFLGLRTLTVIQDAKMLIKKIYSKEVDFGKLDDAKVYKLYGEGKTEGVFQFESAGFKQMSKDLKPDNIEDIVVLISLYRPGPMDQIPRYIRNKNNANDIEYTHRSLESILKVTYGCMVYQEQVMQIFRDLAGYSLGRADLVRRAMGKKKLDVMAKERDIFINGLLDESGNIVIDGAIRRGVDEKSANRIFDEMAEFAKYAFNKSHAAAYAVISYQTAYLKTYYPCEFMAATLNSFIGNLDKVPQYIAECKKMGIEVLKPDINESYQSFAVVNSKIRFGLVSVKNVGEKAIECIVNERKTNGKYKDFIDFLNRIDTSNINKKCIESLIKAGTFDEFEKNRFDLLENYEKILDDIIQIRKKNFENQINLFSIGDNKENDKINNDFNLKPSGKIQTKKDILTMEKEMTGIYISGHPLDDYKDEMEKFATISTLDTIAKEEIEENENLGIEKAEEENNKVRDGQEVSIVGIIQSLKLFNTKNNQTMAFVTLEDLYGTVEVVIFPNTYMRYRSSVVIDNPVILKGKVSSKENENAKILCDEINTITKQKKLYIKVLKDVSESITDEIKKIAKKYSGSIPLYVYYEKDDSIMVATRDYWLDDNTEVVIEYENLLGKENVKLV